MTDFIQEYLNSRNRRQYGSNTTIQSGPDGNTLSMGTFPGDIFGQNVEMKAKLILLIVEWRLTA